MGADTEILEASKANDVTELDRLINIRQPCTADLYLPLYCGAEKGSIDTARYLLGLGVRYTGDVVTAAVKAGSVPMLKSLREYGWQPDENIGGYNACTTLNVASYHQNLEVVKYLLEVGADPDLGPAGNAVVATWADMFLAKDKGFNLYHAASSGCVEVMKLLLKYSAFEPAKAFLIHGAVESGSVAMLEYILGLGLDVDELDDTKLTGRRNGYGTPLHRAVASTHDIAAVKTLLAHGASINKTGTLKCNGKTVVDVIMEDKKDNNETSIPDAIKDLIREAALRESMA